MALHDLPTPVGKRYRLVGYHPVHEGALDSFTRESLEEPLNSKYLYEQERKADSNIDVWVTVVSRGIKNPDPDYCLVRYDNFYGYGDDIEELFNKSELQKLAEHGMELEKQRRALESGIAKQCVLENLIPMHEPSMLRSLHQQGLLELGQPLIIDGIHYGEIKDLFTSGEDIFVKTTSDAYLFSTVNITNEYLKQINPCYTVEHELGHSDILPLKDFMFEYCDSIDCKLYDLERYFKEDYASYFKSSLKDNVFNNADFMYQASKLASTYAQSLGFNDVSELSQAAKNGHPGMDKAVQNVLSMIKCEMVDYGYREIAKDRPHQQALDYLQNLGYSQAAMSEKSAILGRWMQDKQLTINEKIAAEAIISGKPIYALLDIEPGSIRQKYKHGALFYDKTYSHVTEPCPYDNGAIKLKCTQKDLTSGEIKSGTVKIAGPIDLQDITSAIGPRTNDTVARTDEAIYTFNFDISSEYLMFGGYNSDRALLYLQEQNWQHGDNEFQDIEEDAKEIEQQ